VLRLTAGMLEVALWNDWTYSRNSTDNVHAYDAEVEFAGTGRHWQPIGARVSEGGRVLRSAVLLIPFGAGELGPERFLARPGTLYLPAGTELAALDLPSLQVRWETESHLCGVLGIHPSRAKRR
jgi:hypothetical protein